VVETRLAELATVGRTGDMSTRLVTRTKGRASGGSTGIIVSVQTGGTKETYLRAVCNSIDEVEATVKAMLADPDAYTIGKLKRKWKAPAPVKKDGDGEQIPGTVAATVGRALDDVTELAGV
jgi:hypothetical protein